jgi:hypothetical protein
MSDELKKCPDCAEMVRAEARVCRFCGYRFDGTRRATGGAGSLGEFLIRRSRTSVPLPELLAGWGVELGEGETAGYFGYCGLDDAHGFLLITNRRLAFFAGRRNELKLEWPLGDVRGVERAGRWGGRQLRVTGPERTVVLRRFDSAQALDEVAGRLG